MTQQAKRLIYLTGFMGSGKSTIGPIVANTIGFEFLDLDALVEKKAGKKVVEVFQSEGEAKFRTMERELLAKVSGYDGFVIALGGGTITDDGICRLIRSTGLLIYLQLQPEEIHRRVKHRQDRPLLHTAEGKIASDEELQSKINGLLQAREKFYRQADIVIPVDHKRIGDTVDAIVKLLPKFGRL
jgi:shikimate kinase